LQLASGPSNRILQPQKTPSLQGEETHAGAKYQLLNMVIYFWCATVQLEKQNQLGLDLRYQ
jgi:hypothetical protein